MRVPPLEEVAGGRPAGAQRLCSLVLPETTPRDPQKALGRSPRRLRWQGLRAEGVGRALHPVAAVGFGLQRRRGACSQAHAPHPSRSSPRGGGGALLGRCALRPQGPTASGPEEDEAGTERGGRGGGRGTRGRRAPCPGQLLTRCGRVPRVCGSYELLWAGQVADALVDLTGGLAERWSLKDGPGGPEHRTCRRLLGLKDRCLISCSVLSPRAGEGGLLLGPHQGRVDSDTFVLQSWCLVCDRPCHLLPGGRCPCSPTQC